MSDPSQQSSLATNAERFRDLAEMSSDWFWEQDGEFRFTALWGRVYAEGRLNPRTTLGKRRWELGIIGVSDERWRAHRATLERHEPFRDFIYQFVNPLGETRWLTASGKPVFDEQGRFAGYRGTGHDVTERKQAETAQQSREAELRLLTDNVPAAIGYIGRDLVLRFANRGFQQLFGHHSGSRVGVPMRDGMGAETFAWIEPYFRLVLSGKPASYRRPDTGPDGAQRILNVSLVPHWAEDGSILGCYSVTVDLTATERSENQVRSLQTLFTSTFQHTTDLMAIYRVEPGRLIIEGFNQSLQTFYSGEYPGLDVRDWFGRSLDEFLRVVVKLDEPDIERRLLSFWRVVASGEVARYQTALPHGGRTHRRDALIVPISGGDGGVTHLFYRGADITALVEKEEALQALNADLEHKVLARTAELTAANADLESFAYSVSHDLRSPLRAINGFSQLLFEDAAGLLDANSIGHLQKIRANTLQMSNLIDDMLKLANVSRTPLKLTPVDLSALAEQLAAELSQSDPTRAVEWRIEPGATVTADAGLMRQLLQNLLGNAWKYSRGRVPARISLGIAGIQSGDARGYARLCLRDNGAGFDMAYADKLFQPFQRLHGAAEFEGTGIGLAIVARIVQRHGGTIEAEGVPDQGAAFHFELPLAAAGG